MFAIFYFLNQRQNKNLTITKKSNFGSLFVFVPTLVAVRLYLVIKCFCSN